MSFASFVTCSASLCQFLFSFGVGRRWLFLLNLAFWLRPRISFHASFSIHCLLALVHCSFGVSDISSCLHVNVFGHREHLKKFVIS
jgi:hypothetical protein